MPATLWRRLVSLLMLPIAILPIVTETAAAVLATNSAKAAGLKVNPPPIAAAEVTAFHDRLLATAGRLLWMHDPAQAARVDVLMSGPTSSGMSNERVAFVRATGLRRIHAGGGDLVEWLRTLFDGREPALGHEKTGSEAAFERALTALRAAGARIEDLGGWALNPWHLCRLVRRFPDLTTV